jgi:hypothetical protein
VAILAALSVTGFALFFVTEPAPQWWNARSHEILGLAITLFGIEHWVNGSQAGRALSRSQTAQSTESSSS